MGTLRSSAIKAGFFILILMAGSVACAASLIEVNIRQKNSVTRQVELSIELKNISRKPLVLLRDELPWNSSSAMLFVVTDLGGGPLRQISPLIQPNLERQVKIEPGSTLSGATVLDDSIPSLSANLQKRELIVFWTYKPSEVHRSIKKIERVGGHFLLTRQQHARGK